MQEIQKEVLSVLLQTLLDEKLITQKTYDAARDKIRNALEMPQFLRCPEDE